MNRGFFEGVFRKAGLSQVYLTEIPEEYWPKTYGEKPPWFLARLPYGNIKIGWRKRVISIDWSDTKRDLLFLFGKEDVTKTEHMIHAWGEAKAIEYLEKIHKVLS